MTVRALRPGDWPDWRRLWRGYLDFYQTRLPDAQYRATFARLTAEGPRDLHGLVAQGGRAGDAPAIGLAHYLYHPHGWQTQPVCYLQDLFVDPGARRSGAGEALIRAVYAAADAAGAEGVYWTTQAENWTARRLYDRVGRLTPFVKYERA